MDTVDKLVVGWIILAVVTIFLIGYFAGASGECPACVCGECSVEFHECPPTNVTIVYHDCEASELNFSGGVEPVPLGVEFGVGVSVEVMEVVDEVQNE